MDTMVRTPSGHPDYLAAAFVMADVRKLFLQANELARTTEVPSIREKMVNTRTLLDAIINSTACNFQYVELTRTPPSFWTPEEEARFEDLVSFGTKLLNSAATLLDDVGNRLRRFKL